VSGSRTRQAGGYRDQVGAHPSPWEGAVPALDVFLHDLGLGVFVAATVAALVAPAVMAPLLRVAWPLSATIVALDMLLLLVDLGDWTRFFHMFRVFKPTTPMSLGVWALSGFLGVMAVPAAWGVLSLLGRSSLLPGSFPWTVAALALLLAMPATLYKGAVFSVTSQPGWRDARWTAGYFAASSVLFGVAVLGTISGFARTPAAHLMWRAVSPLVLLDTALLAAWSTGLSREMTRRMPRREIAWFWMTQLGSRAAAVLVTLLAPPSATAFGVVALLILFPGYSLRSAFLRLPHLPRLAGLATEP